jgi:predicted PurR-regulated permease PerM
MNQQFLKKPIVFCVAALILTNTTFCHLPYTAQIVAQSYAQCIQMKNSTINKFQQLQQDLAERYQNHIIETIRQDLDLDEYPYGHEIDLEGLTENISDILYYTAKLTPVFITFYFWAQ